MIFYIIAYAFLCGMPAFAMQQPPRKTFNAAIAQAQEKQNRSQMKLPLSPRQATQIISFKEENRYINHIIDYLNSTMFKPIKKSLTPGMKPSEVQRILNNWAMQCRDVEEKVKQLFRSMKTAYFLSGALLNPVIFEKVKTRAQKEQKNKKVPPYYQLISTTLMIKNHSPDLFSMLHSRLLNGCKAISDYDDLWRKERRRLHEHIITLAYGENGRLNPGWKLTHIFRARQEQFMINPFYMTSQDYYVWLLTKYKDPRRSLWGIPKKYNPVNLELRQLNQPQ